MTEQEKQVLAGLCRIEIKRWKAAAESNPNMRYIVELMEVALASLMAESGWVKCSDMMPEVGAEVLIRITVCDHFNIENAKYEGEGKFLGAWYSMRGAGCAYKVAHWQPLPAPPEAQ